MLLTEGISRANVAANDVAGNFSLTLIDILDTFVVLDDRQGFEMAVRNIIDWVSFDVNTKPQVFETTIRVLGGLLSGHIFSNQTGQPFYLPWYRGELLSLAHDLGKRLLPAFATPTGLPYARVYATLSSNLVNLFRHTFVSQDQSSARCAQRRNGGNMYVSTPFWFMQCFTKGNRYCRRRLFDSRICHPQPSDRRWPLWEGGSQSAIYRYWYSICLPCLATLGIFRHLEPEVGDRIGWKHHKHAKWGDSTSFLCFQPEILTLSVIGLDAPWDNGNRGRDWFFLWICP